MGHIGVIRTAKAERRHKDRLREEGLLTDEDDKELSPAEERALRAEKRAAWRQARLKSLEQVRVVNPLCTGCYFYNVDNLF